MAMTHEGLSALPHADALAGYCMEITAWQLLLDLTAALNAVPIGSIATGDIAPGHIVVDEGHFLLQPTHSASEVTATEPGIFDAPEATTADSPQQEALVWSLAATVFYLVMGCAVMNGRGGRSQRPTSKLPYMRSEMPELSELVQRCLSFDPQRRPTLEEVHAIAAERFAECQRLIKAGPRLRPSSSDDSAQSQSATDELWPEEMMPAG